MAVLADRLDDCHDHVSVFLFHGEMESDKGIGKRAGAGCGRDGGRSRVESGKESGKESEK